MTERDEPYVPSLADGQSYYVAGRAHLRRQITGERALDITPYSHEFDRMIEAVRAEEREKAAQIADGERIVTDIEQEARALRAAICGCGGGEDSHPEGRNHADDEMAARIMKAGFRRPAPPATRETVTEETVERMAEAIRRTPWPLGTTSDHLYRLQARAALEAALAHREGRR